MTVIPESEYTACKALPPLLRIDKAIHAAGMNHLTVREKFTATLRGSHQNNTSMEDVYVVSGLQSGLLGPTASVALRLIARVDATFCRETVIEQS